MVSLIALRVGAGVASAVIFGMLFVSHPLTVEAAAYVAGRRDLLALSFSLLSVLLWIGAGASRGRAALALAAIVAATLSKESGLIAVALCSIASMCGLGPKPASAAVPLLVTAAISVSSALLYGAIGPYWVSADPAAAVRIAGALSAHYATSLVMPLGLSIDHPELVCSGAACTNLAGPLSRLGVACIVALLSVATLLISRVRDATLAARGTAFAISGVAVVLVALSVAIGGHEPGADRHAYPLVALAAVAMALLADDFAAWLGSGTARRIAGVLALVVVAACLRVSDARMTIWETEWTLWSSAVAQAHVSARAHHNMGRLQSGAGAYALARRHFRKALAIDRRFAPAVVALAALECERSRYRRAAHRFEKARALGAAEPDVVRVREACDSQRVAG
jgi:hypothetical protein